MLPMNFLPEESQIQAAGIVKHSDYRTARYSAQQQLLQHSAVVFNC